MTKTIVVALDGSELAERALAPATWLGRELPAEVRLITASFAPDVTGEADYLARLADATGLDHVGHEVVRHEFAAAALAEAVAIAPDAAVCMTTRGRGGLAELLLGSVSDEVLRTVDAPVVLVGPHCGTEAPASRNLVVSVDGSDASTAVYPVVATWASALGLDVHVVSVAQTGLTGLEDVRSIAARDLVERAREQLAALGVDACTHVLNSAYPADVVVAFATGLPAALIALGTHGHGGLSAKALGHVATDIVRHSPCPVVVRRPAA